MVCYRVLRAVLLAAALIVALCAPAAAYLRVHPSNRHYFQETATGKSVLIASVYNLVPEHASYDDIGGMNATALRRRQSWCRVWHVGAYSDGQFEPWNFSSTAACGSLLPARIDMNTNNPVYWTRMDNSLTNANAGGVYAEMMIFDRCSMSPAAQDRWENNVWATDNNVNNLETPSCSPNDGTPEFYQWSSKPNLKYYQEAWIKKLIDETIQYPNIVYEVENEHWGSNSSGWADHYGQFVKDYIAANYSNSPRLTSYSSIVSDADLDQCFNWPAIDVINRHSTESVTAYIEARWHYNKPINIDEFANDVEDPNILRQECWTIVTSGGNYHIEDATDLARPADICENVRSFIALSGWDFIGSSPDHTLITSGTGYCMENPGVEYVCYFPTGGNKTVNIAAGSYREEWWNPITGGFHNVTSYTHGGGNRVFTPPDGNDWVLHVTTSAALTTVLTSKPVAAHITIDGNPSDWNLGEFTTKIRGGSAGTGDIGLVEFDTDLVCYVGGHYDGWQILPSNAADHSAKIYARDNSMYLYLLVRCEDDDMQFSNGIITNYLNDCVEIYIDPGHDHGSSAMSASTSDVRLVIDANNVKYVYNTTATYRTNVLAGVSSAVVRDATGWWLEARITKTVLNQDIPSGAGTIGIDFAFHDNDSKNSSTVSTTTSWRDPEVSTSFPSKIPDRWGDLRLVTLPDITAPGPVTSFVALPGDQQVSLSWHNPSDSDFTGTMIRCKTGTYPTGPTDGMLVVDKPKSPNTNDNHVDISLTNGTTYYYSAFAHDAVPNYAAKADASATPIYFGPLQAKACADGTQLTMTIGTVSAVFGDSFYVQCIDPACGVCGIRVVGAGSGLQEGQSAVVKGTILTDPSTAERYISATWVQGSGP